MCSFIILSSTSSTLLASIFISSNSFVFKAFVFFITKYALFSYSLSNISLKSMSDGFPASKVPATLIVTIVFVNSLSLICSNISSFICSGVLWLASTFMLIVLYIWIGSNFRLLSSTI